MRKDRYTIKTDDDTTRSMVLVDAKFYSDPQVNLCNEDKSKLFLELKGRAWDHTKHRYTEQVVASEVFFYQDGKLEEYIYKARGVYHDPEAPQNTAYDVPQGH